MNFGFTEEQLELQEMVREFVAKEITPMKTRPVRNCLKWLPTWDC